jgi:xylulokinase
MQGRPPPSRKDGSCLMGIDLGTSSAKGVVCTLEGTILAEHRLLTGAVGSRHGEMEQDPQQQWWVPLCRLSRELMSMAGSRRRVLAVGVTGLFPSFVALDDQGSALVPGILYLDSRGNAEARDALKSRDSSIPYHFTSKILWLKRSHPELFRRSQLFLPAPAYVLLRLTGNTAVDRALGTDALLLPPGSHDWSADGCREIGVSMERLPRVREASSVVGGITAEAARATGLEPGTPVITGTGDICAEALAAGIASSGRALLVYGSTACLLLCTDRIALSGGIGLCPHVLAGLYLLVGGTSTSGAALDWLIDSLYQAHGSACASGRPELYEQLNDEASSVPPGCNGLMVLPHLRGARAPIRNPEASGVVLGLTLGTRREQLYRAFLEGVAYSIRHILEVMTGLYGAPRPPLAAAGGGYANRLLRQVVSDVLQLRQQGTPRSGAAPGAAYLAGVGVGALPDPKAQTRQWFGSGEVCVEPDPSQGESYGRYFALYKSMLEAVQPGVTALAQLARG